MGLLLLLDWDVRWSLLSDVDVDRSLLSDVDVDWLLLSEVLLVDVCLGRLSLSVVDVGRLSLPPSLLSSELLVCRGLLLLSVEVERSFSLLRDEALPLPRVDVRWSLSL